MLLDREEVKPDKPGNSGTTPLSVAAMHGHEGVVKMLLQREEVNPGKPNDRGTTPMSFAAKYGHEGVVKILLKREEVSPDRPDLLKITGDHAGSKQPSAIQIRFLVCRLLVFLVSSVIHYKPRGGRGYLVRILYVRIRILRRKGLASRAVEGSECCAHLRKDFHWMEC